jgi:hypothetical protein
VELEAGDLGAWGRLVAFRRRPARFGVRLREHHSALPASSCTVGAMAEVAGYDAQVQAAWNGSVDRFAARMAERLAEDQAAGLAPSDVDPLLAAQVLTRGGERVIAQQVACGDPARDSLVARELAAQHWYGAFRRPPRA